jgi:hypothetical protein
MHREFDRRQLLIGLLSALFVVTSGCATFRRTSELEAAAEELEELLSTLRAANETELLARCSPFRWVLPLFGNAERLRTFLAGSNIEACYPVTASSAFFGHDNHSYWYVGGSAWDVHGLGENGL